MPDSVKKVMLLTTEEAIELVKRSERVKGSRFAVYVRLDAHIENAPDHVFPDGCSSYVSLSKSEALRLVSNTLSPVLEKRGGRIRITEHRSDNTALKMADTVTYWIG